MPGLKPGPVTDGYFDVETGWQTADHARLLARAERAAMVAEGNLDELARANSGKLTVEQVALIIEARCSVSSAWALLAEVMGSVSHGE